MRPLIAFTLAASLIDNPYALGAFVLGVVFEILRKRP